MKILCLGAGGFIGSHLTARLPGYEDSDRRIPDIVKARTLLGWEPRWKMRELLEVTMRYYVMHHTNQSAIVDSLRPVAASTEPRP